MNPQRINIKAEKKKSKQKKYKRMVNILKAWQAEERNRRSRGEKPRLMPITFKERGT